jgi:cell shape-determining protein MreD
MNALNTLLILATAFLVVFWEAAFQGLPRLLRSQIDLLPALMVYASLSTDLAVTGLLAFFGGLWFDALSANPLGITVLPLFAIGLAIHICRDLILRDQAIAQVVLGAAASASAPLLTLLLLLTTGRNPLAGWGTLWQLFVMTVAGAAATPLFFVLFDWLKRTFVHSRVAETSFREDREIRRGR